MYAVKEVSREEWVFRGLAIAICLAMVGLAVMSTLSSECFIIPHQSKAGYGLTIYGISRGNSAAVEIGITLWDISNYITPITPYGALVKLGLLL